MIVRYEVWGFERPYLFPACRVVRHVLDDDVDGVEVRDGLVVLQQKGGQEAREGEAGQHRHGVGRKGVQAGEHGVHDEAGSEIN